jgi:hypothetical protein
VEAFHEYRFPSMSHHGDPLVVGFFLYISQHGGCHGCSLK